MSSILKSILVVDDDPAFLANLSSALSGSGYRVLNAADGQEALDVLEKSRIDVVVIDLVLPPGTNSQELIAAVAKRNTKVIATTAQAGESELEVAKYIGADLAIQKFPEDPTGAFPRKQWIQTIEAVLNPDNAAQA